MKKLIVINGSGTSGKDEVARLSRVILGKKMKVITISSIDAVKDRALIFDWDGKKDDKGRRLLSDLKDSWTRYINGPFNDIIKKINGLDEKKDWLVYVHIREPDEIRKLVEYYDDIITLLIQRDEVESFNNHADQEVCEYPYRFTIHNNGTLDELKEKVECFLKVIKIL